MESIRIKQQLVYVDFCTKFLEVLHKVCDVKLVYH
jgi:hypothetical protein